MKQAVHCLTRSGFTDPFLGSVSLDPESYCLASCLRGIPGVSCCAPMSPDQIDPTFLLFHRSSPKTSVNLTWDEVNSPALMEQASTYSSLVVVVHGWQEPPISSDGNNDWMFRVKDGFLSRGKEAVLIVNWDHGNGLDYAQSAANVRTVGMMIGRIIAHWRLQRQTLLVGHSMGAQVLGEAGRFVQRLTGSKIKECHALDPAGQPPLFELQCSTQ